MHNFGLFLCGSGDFFTPALRRKNAPVNFFRHLKSHAGEADSTSCVPERKTIVLPQHCYRGVLHVMYNNG